MYFWLHLLSEMAFLLFLCALCISTAWSIRSGPQYALEDAEIHFENFIKEHSKQYADENEKQARFEIFKMNLEEVNRLNEGQDDAVFGLTFFMDLTHEEFLRRFTGLNRNVTDSLIGRSNPCEYVTDIQDVGAPESFDWRQYNVVTPVRQQMNCGSCYAFSAIGNIESQYAIKYRQLLDLSEQQIVDCDRMNKGCDGGHMTNAFRYLIEAGGSESEYDYPYRDGQGRCLFNRRKVKARITECWSFNLRSQEKLKQLLYTYGPISVGIQSSGIKTYRGGLIRDARCNVGNLNHEVLLVGYGTRNGVPVWIGKNSWGTAWGEQGFFYMVRGDNAQSCGMMHSFIAGAIIP